MAGSMVKQFGMSRMGRVCFQERQGPGYLNGQGGGHDGDRAYSEETAREIDMEVREIINEATATVRDLLRSRRDVLEDLAHRLMEKEVIGGPELRELLAATGSP
ncbi:MAG: hypothetical protein U0736_03670 [Gemmataceae bacterium]